MLNTLKATLSPSGTLTFDESIKITKPVAVLVTLLDEQPVEGASPATEDPLECPLNETELGVWQELPAFRARHPVSFDSLEEPA